MVIDSKESSFKVACYLVLNFNPDRRTSLACSMQDRDTKFNVNILWTTFAVMSVHHIYLTVRYDGLSFSYIKISPREECEKYVSGSCYVP